MAQVRKAFPNGHSLAVTLPADWCKFNEVVAGSELILDLNNMSVVVSKYYDESEDHEESVLTSPAFPKVKHVEEPRRVYTDGESLGFVDGLYREFRRR